MMGQSKLQALLEAAGCPGQRLWLSGRAVILCCMALSGIAVIPAGWLARQSGVQIAEALAAVLLFLLGDILLLWQKESSDRRSEADVIRKAQKKRRDGVTACK